MDELDKKIKHIWRKSKKQAPDMKAGMCPGHNMLASYIDGALRDADKDKMERHILECGHCLDLVMLHHKVKESEAIERVPKVPAFLVRRARDLVTEKETREGIMDIVLKFARETIEIITNPGNLGISYTAAPVPVRGEKKDAAGNHISLHKNFADMESDVDILKTGEGRVNIRILSKDIASGRPVEGARISLLNPEREMASHIARKGEVLFEGLSFGKYMIRISRKGREAGHISIDIKE